ncbi:hypothetical protein SSAG_05419 [Streptomyces sp. Mg1]|nr:hypothetical protein SSAG_05419 [Streptomyces sp. Mg1]
MIGKKARHEQTGVRVTGEEAVQVTVDDLAGGVGEVTDLEPGDGVDELVHADRDQRAVDDTEEAGADGAQSGHPLAEVGDDLTDRLPDQTEEHAGQDADEGHDDRDETAAVEEAEPVHQLGAVVALPQDRGEQAHDDAAEDAGVVVRRGDVDTLVLGGVDDGLGHREGGEDVLVDEEADERGERRGTVRLLREADRDADAEQQRQVREDGVTGGGEHRGDLAPAETVLAEDVGLAEAQQDAGGGQDGDGQLEAAADLLQTLDQTGPPLLGGRCGGVSSRTHNFLRGARRRQGGGTKRTATSRKGGTRRRGKRSWSTPMHGVDQL